MLTAADIPGDNDISPVGAGDDPVFANGEVSFYGQPLFAVVAANARGSAGSAARLRAGSSYEERSAVIDADDAVETRVGASDA